MIPVSIAAELNKQRVPNSLAPVEGLYVRDTYRFRQFGQGYRILTVCIANRYYDHTEGIVQSSQTLFFDSCETTAMARPTIPAEFSKLPFEQLPFSSQVPVRSWATLQNIKPWPIEYSLVFVVDRQNSQVSAIFEQRVSKLDVNADRSLKRGNC